MRPSILLLAACVGCAQGSQGRHSEVHEHHTHAKNVLVSELGIAHKSEYWGTIMVGTPAKEYTVVFDTGSGNLILPSAGCTSFACKQHTRYDPKDSKTSVAVGMKGLSLKEHPEQKTETTIMFGTGKIHGQFYQDQLCLGGDRACLKANFIGTDYESDEPFGSCRFDGIMGLGFKDLSMGDGFNMVDDVVLQHSLPSNKFSVYLKDDWHGSELVLGGYKKKQVASEMIWAPVTRESYWQIAIEDVTFNNQNTGLCPGCQVAVDTGTSSLCGPSDFVERLAEKMDFGQDCSNYYQMPVLGFSLGGTVLNLLPEDYTHKVGRFCALALTTLDVPPPKGPLFIFGAPFLRRYLTVFDRDGPRVGFAVARHKGVDAAVAQRLLHTKEQSGQADQDEEELDLIRLHSTIHSEARPIDESKAGLLRGSATSGVLQKTEADDDTLVTVKLARHSVKP